MSSLRNRLRLRRASGDKTLAPVIPNAGIAAKYRRKLEALVAEMDVSVQYWIKSAFKNNEPIAMDAANPATELEKAIKNLTRRWQRRFNTAAEEMAAHFAEDISDRVDGRLEQILNDAGWSVKFRMTAAQRDVVDATVNQNVSLIKSIPAKYLSGVEGAVMRAVQTGGDFSALSKTLQKSYGVTKRRAAFIAHDQSRKATSALTTARYKERGITEAIWVHSSAGKEPRPTHLANNGNKYDVAKGWYDPHEREWIHPGQLINCRCFSRAVIPGFS